MKLKFRGVLCPECGEYATIFARDQEFDQWIGYIHQAQCPENCSVWLLLFDDKRRFCGIVREHDCVAIGGYRYLWEFPPNLRPDRDVDEIPF